MVGWFSSTVTLSSVTGGSLTWTIDKQFKSGSVNAALVSAQAPAGLAGSTVLTANYSATTTGRAIGGGYFTGVATSAPGDGSASASSGGTQTPWTAGGVATTNADDVVVGAAMGDLGGTAGLSTPTAPWLEILDFNLGASGDQYTMVYRIVSSTATYTPAGTWAVAAVTTGVAAAYMADTGGAAAAPTLTMAPFQGAY